jgi:hypothetical protein
MYCLAHDPERRDEVTAARSQGARKANSLRAFHGKRLKLDSASALLKFVSGLAQDTLSGVVEPDVSRAVAYAVSLQIKLVELADHERRLADLERQYGQRGRSAP